MNDTSLGDAGPRRRGASTAIAGLAFGVAILIVVTGLGGLLVWRDYEGTVSRTEIVAANAAHTAAEHVRWLVEASLLVLRQLDELLGDDVDTSPTADITELADAIGRLPGAPAAFVADASGATVFATGIDDAPVSIANETFFATLQRGLEWEISTLLTELVPGRGVFIIARRIERASAFVGVAGIIVPVSKMADVWSSLDLGPDSSVALIRSDGWLVARYPVPAATINLSGQMLFERIAEAPAGFYHGGGSPADGVVRIVGYYAIPDLPLITVAGVSRDAALARFWNRLRLLAAVGVPLVAALVFFGLWLTVLLRRDRQNHDRLAVVLKQNETLLAEIHHRVKNNLQLVASLVRLQPGTEEAKQELTRRITAVSAVHEQLYLTNRFGEIDVADYLRGTIEALRTSYRSSATINYQLEPVFADVNMALPLALIVSEVASNIFKHAFDHDSQGVINVVAESDAGELHVRLSDNGRGFDPAKPKTSGFGMKLLQSLSQQVGGRYEFVAGDGMTFDLRVPLPKTAAGIGST